MCIGAERTTFAMKIDKFPPCLEKNMSLSNLEREGKDVHNLDISRAMRVE